MSVESTPSGQTVYMSELLKGKYPDTCQNLVAILEKHHVKYAFLKGTRDIWCRDYMPVRLESGKLIQFRYEPCYLMEDSRYEAIRSDVHEVCRQNNITAQDSDINLDGGNVLICDGRVAIEIKSKDHINHDDKKGVTEFAKEHPDTKQILVSRDRISRRSGDVDLYYVTDFFKALWAGEII